MIGLVIESHALLTKLLDKLALTFHVALIDVKAFRYSYSITITCILVRVYVILFDLTDINECATNNGKGPCLGNASVCINTPGSYYCTCPSPYVGDGYNYCFGMVSYIRIFSFSCYSIISFMSNLQYY